MIFHFDEVSERERAIVFHAFYFFRWEGVTVGNWNQLGETDGGENPNFFFFLKVLLVLAEIIQGGLVLETNINEIASNGESEHPSSHSLEEET